jgi:hypothetical protein
MYTKLNPGFLWQTQHSARTKLFSTVNWKELVKCYIWSIDLYGDGTLTVLKVVEQYLESLKCGAGEGWGISVGPIV